MARQFGIVDRPNDRSSHTDLTTVRGGGILFYVAQLGAFFYSDFAYPYFFAGLTLVATVSFLDDLRPLPSRYRIGAQFAGMALLLYETGLISSQIWVIGALLVVCVGILNAYNFMDGINGITAWYSLVCVGTLWFWQRQLQLPSANVLLPFAFIALLLFSYVNARRRAVCFAGDVGSVSMGFIIQLPLIQIIHSTDTYLPVLILAIYGVDTVLTILHRLYQRQNIFQAHRQHLFQWLVHKLKWPHLHVSVLYAGIQLLINVMIIRATNWNVEHQLGLAVGVLAVLTGVYIVIKRQ
jgi:UDP-N-acetylmuramyl pentapeptide phosphotransferase/UDP-N-acetylglucosamine-1-phosphate transferase